MPIPLKRRNNLESNYSIADTINHQRCLVTAISLWRLGKWSVVFSFGIILVNTNKAAYTRVSSLKQSLFYNI